MFEFAKKAIFAGLTILSRGNPLRAALLSVAPLNAITLCVTPLCAIPLCAIPFSTAPLKFTFKRPSYIFIFILMY